MTSQRIEDHSQHLEERVVVLKEELARMKELLANLLQSKQPWWLRVAGSFENDPTFDEAVRLGQEWRGFAE